MSATLIPPILQYFRELKRGNKIEKECKLSSGMSGMPENRLILNSVCFI